MSGWIKLHRSIKEWEWYGDINVRLTFLHCLISANYEDKKWQGVLIKRGSFVTGRDVLASEIGISVRQVRTALTKLKSTSDLTTKTTSKGTLVTVMNYNKFQSKDDEATSGTTSTLTGERPENDQQTTTTKKDKNIRIKEESKEAPAPQEFPTLEKVLSFAKSQPMIIQPDCAETYFNDMEACEWVDKFNRPIKKWQAALRAYASRWNQFSQKKSTPSHRTSTPVKYGI